jgi:PAB1-binding protein PBP1
MFGAAAPVVSFASSRATPNTCPTSLACAANTVVASISCPAGGPAGCSCWMTMDWPSGSMKVWSRGSPLAGGVAGGTTPEKPVTIGSPGANIAGSAACATDTTALIESGTTANNRADTPTLSP